MQRSRIRVLFGGAVVLAFSCATYVLLWPARPVNILLITLDTTRADRLGCYGYRPALTPTLDRLASEGVLFERAYASAPLTLPSHATMFTGLYPPEHGLRTNGRGKLDTEIPVLPALLNEAGYDTGGFVASFVLDSKFGLDRGFSVYDDDLRNAAPAEDVLHRERDGAAVVKSAIRWLKAPRSKPFCCWVHLYDPHYPYKKHESEFGDRFRDSPYDAEIAYVDQQIKRLLDQLRESGLDSKTVVVIVGDHGEGLGDHVEQNHGYTLYNSTQHVPLILRMPGRITPGHRHTSPVSLVDLFPTLCEFLRLKVPAEISGQSFGPALSGQTVGSRVCYAATDDPFLQEGWSPLRSLTNERWKYIRTTKPELYDLQTDFGESRNLAATDSKRLADMEHRLQEIEQKMTIRESRAVQLSSHERKTLESLGYLGKHGATVNPDQSTALTDVKDMLQDDVEARQALELLHSGQTDEAVERLLKIVQRSPVHAASRVYLGQGLESQGDITAAMLQYQDALRIKPDRVDALIRLGAAHGTRGELDEAVEIFNEALQIDPDSALVRISLGQALSYQGRLEEAVSHFEEALQQDPEMAGIHLALGESLRQLGRGEEAVSHLEEEIRRNPYSVPARLNLAAILSKRRPNDAFQLLSEALEIQPRNPHIHFQIGEFLLAQGRPAEAIISLSEALRLMPDHPQAAAVMERARHLLKKPNPDSFP